MMQITPVGEKGAVRTRPGCLKLTCCPGGSFPDTGTFGDDPVIRKNNVLGTAARDVGDRRMQPHTLLDAHGQEGQLGQVVPVKTPSS
jgi:hypothetical protein